VLDEPMNGLDPVGRRDVAAVIRRLGEEGACVLVSSHVLHEVDAVARRILAMDHGRVVADGTVAGIRSDLSDRPSLVRVRSPQAREVGRRLLALDSTGAVSLGNAEVLVTTTRPQEAFDEIARLAVEEGIAVEEFQPTDEDLEAVFRYLTGAR
jgi:ABC-2 type transport system ATP-binding protein